MDSSLRRSRNTQRANIAFKDGTPSKSTITDGEELIALRKNKGLSLFRRQKGILWWVNFTRDGNETIEKDLKVDGNAEFSRDLTVKGNLIGQRAYFDAGESTAFTSTKYLSYNDGTLMTATNGYVMIRPGSITGISMCFNSVSVVNQGGALTNMAHAMLNGYSKFKTSLEFGTNATGLKNSKVQARGIDNFVAGDVLTMYSERQGAGNISGQVDNMNVIVEVTYDT